jgi:hypothetical protein
VKEESSDDNSEDEVMAKEMGGGADGVTEPEACEEIIEDGRRGFLAGAGRNN